MAKDVQTDWDDDFIDISIPEDETVKGKPKTTAEKGTPGASRGSQDSGQTAGARSTQGSGQAAGARSTQGSGQAAGARSTQGKAQPAASRSAQGASAPQRRVVKKADKPAGNGKEGSDSSEDMYSGRYQRETSNRGTYTGGTKRDRIMDSTDSPEERERRMERRRRSKRNKIILAVVIVVIVVIIAVVAALFVLGILPPGSGQEEPETMAETAAETEEETEAANVEVTWSQDGNAAISELVRNYYAALSEADMDTLATLVDESVELDEEAVTTATSYVESYEDVVTYVAKGREDGEYAVYVTFSEKFKDIDTAAPGLVPAYVKTDEEGELKFIPYQIYSTEILFDEDVQEYMSELASGDTIQDLSAEVNAAYQEARESDEDLDAFISALEENTGTGSAADGEDEENGEKETTAASSGTDVSDMTFKDADNIQYINDLSVRLREAPSTDSDEVAALTLGTKVHVVAVSDEWDKVVLMDGTARTGYVYNEFLSEDDPTGGSGAEE